MTAISHIKIRPHENKDFYCASIVVFVKIDIFIWVLRHVHNLGGINSCILNAHKCFFTFN